MGGGKAYTEGVGEMALEVFEVCVCFLFFVLFCFVLFCFVLLVLFLPSYLFFAHKQ